MKFNKINFILEAIFIWGPILLLSGLLTYNAFHYFTDGENYGILPEKLVARQNLLWNICFYIHLPAGMFCLFSPVFLFAYRYFKRGLKIHQWIGKLYIWNNFIFICPTGMYLALFAKEGVVSQTGFFIQGILLILCNGYICFDI